MLKDTMVSFLERVQGIGPWGAVLFAAVYIPAAHDRVARSVARRPTLAAIGRAVETDAFEIVLLTRLSPVFSFNLPNYAYGLTSVPFRTYVLVVDRHAAGNYHVSLGSAANSLATVLSGEASRSVGRQALFGLGLASTGAVTIIVIRRARRAVDEIVPLP